MLAKVHQVSLSAKQVCGSPQYTCCVVTTVHLLSPYHMLDAAHPCDVLLLCAATNCWFALYLVHELAQATWSHFWLHATCRNPTLLQKVKSKSSSCCLIRMYTMHPLVSFFQCQACQRSCPCKCAQLQEPCRQLVKASLTWRFLRVAVLCGSGFSHGNLYRLQEQPGTAVWDSSMKTTNPQSTESLPNKSHAVRLLLFGTDSMLHGTCHLCL